MVRLMRLIAEVRITIGCGTSSALNDSCRVCEQKKIYLAVRISAMTKPGSWSFVMQFILSILICDRAKVQADSGTVKT